MPVPTHFKMTVRGHFGSTDEGWSFGCKFERDVLGGPDAELDNISESGVTSAVTGLMASGYFTTGIKTDDWRIYVIGTDGKMEGNGPLLHTFTTPLSGTSSADNHPSSCCLAVTTIADNRGAAQRGRFYLPMTHFPLGADWRIATTTADALLPVISGFLKNVSNAIDLPGTIASADGINVSAGPPGSTTGTKQSIDHLELGLVYDNLKRRRNKLLEARRVGAQIDW